MYMKHIYELLINAFFSEIAARLVDLAVEVLIDFLGVLPKILYALVIW